jgi:hypothetical protein
MSIVLGRAGALPVATRIEVLLAQFLFVSVGVYLLVNRKRSGDFFARHLRVATVNLVVVFALLEIALRLLFSQQLYIRTDETEFYRRDPELGWSMKPTIQGEFSNGYFRGLLHTDRNGNRLNSEGSTYVQGYRNILMIGDSMTASLEVDDHETVSALLESKLRHSGHKVNILNLGVRGFGTDQSVRKALLFADTYRPTDIVYTYVQNDVKENNTIRRNLFAKGVYYQPDPHGAFVSHNYPVPPFDDRTLGLVLMDEKCRPIIFERKLATPPSPPSTPWYFRAFYSLRARKMVKDGINQWFGQDPASNFRSADRFVDDDPFALIKSRRFTLEHQAFWRKMEKAYSAEGVTRLRCRTYFDGQLRYLIGLLRNAPSVARVHVVFHGLPGRTEDVLREDPNLMLFRAMVRDGSIDTLVELPSKEIPDGMQPSDLRCTLDVHFCEAGNQWVAEQLSKEIDFHL